MFPTKTQSYNFPIKTKLNFQQLLTFQLKVGFFWGNIFRCERERERKVWKILKTILYTGSEINQ
jgi:hypothetical protein